MELSLHEQTLDRFPSAGSNAFSACQYCANAWHPLGATRRRKSDIDIRNPQQKTTESIASQQLWRRSEIALLWEKVPLIVD